MAEAWYAPPPHLPDGHRNPAWRSACDEVAELTGEVIHWKYYSPFARRMCGQPTRLADLLRSGCYVGAPSRFPPPRKPRPLVAVGVRE